MVLDVKYAVLSEWRPKAAHIDKAIALESKSGQTNLCTVWKDSTGALILVAEYQVLSTKFIETRIYDISFIIIELWEHHQRANGKVSIQNITIIAIKY